MTARVLICRSNPVAPDPRVEKEARSLSKAGYDVSVLCWDRSGRLPLEESATGIKIYRQHIRAAFARGMLNFLPLLRWQAALLFWLARHHQEYDILHACDFDTILPALFCKKVFGKKVVYDIFDFYADHLRSTPEWIKRLIRSVDLWAIDQADALILVDEARIEQIAGSHPRRIAVLYNSPEDILTDRESTLERDQAGLRLAYVGLMQVERGLLVMLEVLHSHPEWSLEIAGFGGDQELILAAARDLSNVTWYGRVPYPEALAISARADVLFALYDPSISNHRYSSPNKVFEAMMLGKPILVARGTNMDRHIEQAQAGLVVEYDDIPALEASLSKLAEDSDLRHLLGKNARRAYEQRYSWAVMEERLLDLYNNLTSSG